MNSTTMTDLDYLSDVLAESILSIRTTNYDGLAEEEKQQVKNSFFETLKRDNIQVTSELIKQAEVHYANSPMSLFLQEYYNYNISKFSECIKHLTPNRKVTIVKLSKKKTKLIW